jgi:glutamate synthase domain-containing protein 2/glutamate synthase domain-containing protein 3
MMEPWDGPAAVAFTDGYRIGATLDRNGLRPIRWLVTSDDLVVLASEAGALEFAPGEIRAKGRLQPGKMLLVDTAARRMMDDDELKSDMASRRPYRRWVASDQIDLDDLPDAPSAAPRDHAALRDRQRAFGYTTEELQMIVAPMATQGEEPVGSMGNDTPLAVLSDEPQLLFKYFKQLFAQVTNPPIDPIREQLVMSLGMIVGPKPDLLGPRRAGVRHIRIRSPILTDAQLEKFRAVQFAQFHATTLPMLFRASGGAGALAPALEELCLQASRAVADGCTLLVLSDRGVDAGWAPIPVLLATAAVHHHLIREGQRTKVGLIVETGEAREVAHVALLIGYGASAVNAYLVGEALAQMVREERLPPTVDVASAEQHYHKALEKGLLKIFSKMGISTAQSYCGAQIFEAIGLGESLVQRHFTGTASRIGGIGLEELAAETLRRHRAAFQPATPDRRLDAGSEYHVRNPGERHGWNPATIATLQHAAWAGESGYAAYREFSRIASEVESHPSSLRALLRFAEREPVPLEAVEPASQIVKRFATGAMSFGALGKEAHETLAITMNRMGARSNSGEGGEEAERYGTERSSAIKQVASGRFGVTTEYLVSAVELQIKMAQGAKPGEGGQLPGHKVDEVIARTRYSTPGVTLISPPPHHDIYSIEDLAQLIFDLKNVNPRALVSVKLVSAVGVGTIAAGVAKARADLILISGDSGGTGASPLSSIKHAGTPWELGLAETHQTLVLNDLRGRVRLQTDGQLKTGRDVVVAALLGAEEFGFSTAPLIVEGCVMMRKCHLNTCPVGIATQDPVLRAKFRGKPEHLINYFFFVAEETRELMARLGFRALEEMVGRSDVLRPRDMSGHWKGSTLDLSALLRRPEVPPHVSTHCVRAQEHGLEQVLDRELIRLAGPALERGTPVRASLAIRNTDRTVGAMLSGEIARRHGRAALPDDTIRFMFTGSAGQSFGAFCTSGVTLTLEGEANDYFGKGLSGGRLIVYPPAGSLFIPEETIIVGNVALYGATAGEVYLRGLAGERFAVRNSGATAVVEGVGDHACEYMTGGIVVVLGQTGRNFAAGMSGGIAFVLNDDGAFEQHCNTSMVELESVSDRADQLLLKRLVEHHARCTGSARARQLLADWRGARPRFVRVMPLDYKKVLMQRESRQRTAREISNGGRSERVPEAGARDSEAAAGR